MRRWLFALLISGGFVLCLNAQEAAGTVESDLLRLAQTYRRDLAYRLEDGMINARDVEVALDDYLKGRALGDKEPRKQIEYFLRGMKALRGELKPLPQAKWPANPHGIKLTVKQALTVPEKLYTGMGLPYQKDVKFEVVEFNVDKLKEYGVVVSPTKPGKYPLILYLHGAAYGVPDYTLPWMAQLAGDGYVVAAPSMRGEDLLLRGFSGMVEAPDLKCEGQIENLVGEVDDVLAMADGALALEQVAGEKFAIIGHSFGAGAGLLATVRSDKIACMVSYDAWMTNPFRFYWERLANEFSVNDHSYLWGSWPDFTKQPAKDQLAGLMQRSVVHHADQVKAPLLLFVGGAYNGSAYHYSHKQFVKALKKYKKTVRFEIIPGGGHNFVLYCNQQPAKLAYHIQTEWLQKYFPPKTVKVPAKP